MTEMAIMAIMTEMTKVDGNQQQLFDFQDRGATCQRSKSGNNFSSFREQDEKHF